MSQSALQDSLSEHFKNASVTLARQEISMEVPKSELLTTCQQLRDEKPFAFEQLIDVCGVDYLHYGIPEWETNEATGSGFDRGVVQQGETTWEKPRFAVVYHLLSVTHNHRLRLSVFLSEDELIVDSVTRVWPSADWFEREAFDLYGIAFNGHPDLRRILTDYGFTGHPFRKDFPLSGHVEPRYDASLGRVVYEPVGIEPRVLVPKVIRTEFLSSRTSAEHFPPSSRTSAAHEERSPDDSK